MSPRSGATLLELLVACASAALLVAAVSSFARAEGRVLDRESRRIEVREACRRVLDLVARELRGAGFAPLGGSFDGLAAAAGSRLEARSDLHGAAPGDPPDGVADPDSDERIGFSLSSTRGVVSESIGRQTLPLTLESTVPAEGFRLRYFDACGEEIAPAGGAELASDDRERVRRVSARLSVRDPGGETLDEEVTVALRNRWQLRCE